MAKTIIDGVEWDIQKETPGQDEWYIRVAWCGSRPSPWGGFTKGELLAPYEQKDSKGNYSINKMSHTMGKDNSQ